MKVKFTAEIIDDDGNIIGTRTSEADGIPSPEQFDLCTKKGFLRDFDALEKAILKARDQVDDGIAEEFLTAASKKNRNRTKKELQK